MQDAGETPLLKITIASKIFQGAQRQPLEVIRGLAFDIHRGEVVSLIGPSGCGKSTALRIIMGLDRAFDGDVAPSIDALRLGVVFQDARLLPWRTVEDNIRLAAPRIEASELTALLDDLSLDAWRHCRPGELSVGMAKRVAIARALAVAPELLVLDEPFVSLDESGAAALRDFVFRRARESGAAVLMVTHDVEEALLYSDRILRLFGRPTSIRETLSFSEDWSERTTEWVGRKRKRFDDV